MTGQIPPAGAAATDRPSDAPAGASFWTLHFLLLMGVAVMVYSNAYVMLPALPGHLQGIGGSQADLGTAAAAFSGAALVIRPCSGWLVDRFGTRFLIWLGVAVMGLSSLAYLPAGTVATVLLARALQGAGWGFYSVAGTTMASQLASPRQRGAAIGVYGMAGGLALALAPVLGTALGSGPFTFRVAALGGAVGLGMALFLPAPAPRERVRGGGGFQLISRAALLPSAFLLIYMGSYGAVLNFVPVLTAERDLGGPGWFLTPYAVAVFLYRTFSGGLSDQYGRIRIIAPGMLLSAAALAMLAVSADRIALAGAGALFAGGMATIHPASLAWVTDRTRPAERGTALATAIAAQDLGIAGGSFVAGLIADAAGLESAFFALAGLALLGLALAVALDRSSRSSAAWTR